MTIGVPVYNGEPYVKDTLASLLGQDLADIEIVISDNASTDDTESICRSAAAEDSRVRYSRSAVNRGAAWNYNQVLALATAPYFKWAAADDLCAPDFVGRCVNALEAGGPSLVIAYPQTTLIDQAGAEIGPLDDHDLILDDASPARRLGRLLRHRLEWHPVFGVMRTDVLRTTRQIGTFPSADIALLAEMALRGRFEQVPDRLFRRRYHEERSIAAGPSFVEQLAWYKPGRRARFAMPQARLSYELLAAVARSPIPPGQKAQAARLVLQRWTVPHLRHIGGEAKIALRTVRRPRD